MVQRLPVLLDFDGEQAEINHQKFGDVSITWNTADPAQAVVWPTSDGFRLAWRDNQPTELAALRGQSVQAVDLLEWSGAKNDVANGTVAIHVTLTSGQLTVYNALDENGLSFHPPEASWKRHPLA